MLRKISYFVLSIVIVTAIAIYICNKKISKNSEGKIFDSIDSLPYNKVGLLLGTSKFLADGRTNLYYQYRIDATKELMEAGKIKYVIASGDNSRETYDEPTQMKQDLIDAGIDSTHIFLDYAGFRTFDSMVRAKEIFGQDSLTVISQKFHNERAIFIANKEKMAAVGFNAKDVSKNMGIKTQIREKLARVKVYLDYLIGKKPHFLGSKVKIPN
ncbi:MAG: protein SanA [Pseudopedobacter saltans]|uniref:Protein SanA n=1 Tax=Pseudopedobacter saltans TaxID=151895 RepID=A0A2W5ERG8_9SPHI|nr:MAG: protein SanA [Pseudopedobacter saltans]